MMAEMTDADFDRILADICEEDGGRALLMEVPGMYELLAEHFNNHE